MERAWKLGGQSRSSKRAKVLTLEKPLLDRIEALESTLIQLQAQNTALQIRNQILEGACRAGRVAVVAFASIEGLPLDLLHSVLEQQAPQPADQAASPLTQPNTTVDSWWPQPPAPGSSEQLLSQLIYRDGLLMGPAHASALDGHPLSLLEVVLLVVEDPASAFASQASACHQPLLVDLPQLSEEVRAEL